MMPLGECERQPGAPQRALPGAHEVEVRGEAHLDPLLELDAEARAGLHAGRHRACRRRTAPGAPAVGRRGHRGARAVQVEWRMRLPRPRPLRAVGDTAREADVLEPTVIRDRGALGALLLAHQELLRDRRLDDVPRLVVVDRARHQLALGVEPEVAEHLHPGAVAQVLAPGVEAAAATEGRLHGLAEPAVTAREDALEQRGLRVAVLERDGFAPGRLAQHPEPAVELRGRELLRPRERRVRLGHVRRDARGDPEAAVALRAGALPRPGREVGDGPEVVVGLARQPAHEVELRAGVALARRGRDRAQQLLLGVVLVDHVAHPLAAGLWCERDRSFLLRRDAPRHLTRHVVRPGRGQRDLHARRAQLVRQRAHLLHDLRVVGGRQ